MSQNSNKGGKRAVKSDSTAGDDAKGVDNSVGNSADNSAEQGLAAVHSSITGLLAATGASVINTVSDALQEAGDKSADALLANTGKLAQAGTALVNGHLQSASGQVQAWADRVGSVVALHHLSGVRGLSEISQEVAAQQMRGGIEFFKDSDGRTMRVCVVAGALCKQLFARFAQ